MQLCIRQPNGTFTYTKSSFDATFTTLNTLYHRHRCVARSLQLGLNSLISTATSGHVSLCRLAVHATYCWMGLLSAGVGARLEVVEDDAEPGAGVDGGAGSEPDGDAGVVFAEAGVEAGVTPPDDAGAWLGTGAGVTTGLTLPLALVGGTPWPGYSSELEFGPGADVAG